MIHLILNAIVFDLAWLANVMPAAQGMVWVGPVFSLCWLAAHLAAYPATRLSDLRLCLAAAIFGYFADSLLVVSGQVAFPPQAQLGAPSTVWMIALWINLALTLNYSLIWLQHRYLLAALLGAVLGPLAYLAGSTLGAITLTEDWLPLASISLLWLISMPLLVWMAALSHHDKPFREVSL